MIHVLSTAVPESWIDYNDHMTEGYYGVAFGNASDALLEMAGFGAEYRDTQRGSFYTVETHMQYLAEVKVGETLDFETMVLGVSRRSVHAFHVMKRSDGTIAASQETLMLHVNLDEVRVSEMSEELFEKFSTLAETHGTLPRPDGVGRAIKHS